MLKKIIDGILKYKGVIIFALAVLFAVSVVGTVFFVVKGDKINSDVASYLDEKSDTKTGLTFMEEQFGIRGYATIVVRVDERAGQEAVLKEKIGALLKEQSITGITWAGSLDDVGPSEEKISEALGLISENKELIEKALDGIEDEDLQAAAEIRLLLKLAEQSGPDADFIDPSAMYSFLRQKTATDGIYDYVVLFTLATDGAGQESYALLDTIKNTFSYTEFASSGSIETAQRLTTDAMNDLPWFILMGVCVVLVILFLTTSSWIEPFIMLLTLTVGIVISMGMNYLFPSISIISFAISAVLQLAITMDYAVFYVHLYHKNRTLLDAKEATLSTWPEAAASILASGLTTVGGFAALYCMQFRIGADIANVLIKGIVLSVVTVLLLQPILTYLLDKQIVSTTHRFVEKFNRKVKLKKPIEKGVIARPVARFSVFSRIVLVVIALGLFVPCYIAQSKVPFSYLELYEKENKTEEQILSNELGNQIIVAVPLEMQKEGATHKDFAAAIENAGKGRISSVISAFTALNAEEKYVKLLLDRSVSGSGNLSELAAYMPLLGLEEEETEKLTDMVDKLQKILSEIDTDSIESYFSRVDDKWYTLYTISMNGNAEDEEARAIYADIESLCDKYFGKNTTHAIGTVISGYEMNKITPGDFLRVTLVSAAVIFLIVSILLRNPLKSFLIVAVIELGIWINLAFSYLAGEAVNFIVYVIISSVELGCTVDYAILFANTFERNRKDCKTGKECAVLSATQSMPAIFTGALLISSVCFGMYLISSNIVIRQLVGVLARGAAVSFVLVVFLITAVWSFFPAKRKVVDYAAKMKNIQAKLGEEEPTAQPASEEKKPEPAPKKTEQKTQNANPKNKKKK